MPDREPRKHDFEALLRREVGRVLADAAFRRSPVQSRLLGYLCERTLVRGGRISPRAVAVEGLGRPDRRTGSYPRVQVSRLRRNLALHYVRRPPGEGFAVDVPRGDYRLRLAPLPAVDEAAPAAPAWSWKRLALLAAALLGIAAVAAAVAAWRA